MSHGNPIYLERTEKKFKASAGDGILGSLQNDLAQILPRQEFYPGQQVTHNNTLYFDSPDFFLLRQELQDRQNHIRIRARKYEYSSPGFPSPYWIEYKIRKGDTRKKRRLKLKERDLADFILGKSISPEIPAYNQSFLDEESCRALYEEIQEIVLENRLIPLLLVRYQRSAYERGNTRFSVDWGIRYNHVDASVIEAPSLKDTLPDPDGHDPALVVELKYKGAPPDCVQALKKRYALIESDHYSKFLGGMKALLEGPLNKQRGPGDVLQGLFEDRR